MYNRKKEGDKVESGGKTWETKRKQLIRLHCLTCNRDFIQTGNFHLHPLLKYCTCSINNLSTVVFSFVLVHVLYEFTAFMLTDLVPGSCRCRCSCLQAERGKRVKHQITSSPLIPLICLEVGRASLANWGEFLVLFAPVVFGFWPVLMFLIVFLEVSVGTNSAFISYVFFIDTLSHKALKIWSKILWGYEW